jgi:desulfoferrodoxin-like iron-binding protein
MNSCPPTQTHVETRPAPPAREIALLRKSNTLRCTLCNTVVKVVKQRGLGLICCGRDMVPMSSTDE